jgi:hypothetical protein
MLIDNEKQYKASLEFLDELYNTYALQLKGIKTKYPDLTDSEVKLLMDPLRTFTLGVIEDVEAYERKIRREKIDVIEDNNAITNIKIDSDAPIKSWYGSIAKKEN